MREKIDINPNIKGTIVMIKAKSPYYCNWVVIVSHIMPYYSEGVKNDNIIYVHACVGLKDTAIANDVVKKPIRFGFASHYDFYKPTDEEINKLKQYLKAKGFKFIKGINKIIER